MAEAPNFSDEFRQTFRTLLEWRRDVRQFRSEPLPEGLFEEILNLTKFAPSVGLCESWRYVRISRPDIRDKVSEDFRDANARALSGYCGEKAALYARLKLSGLCSAPLHLAAFADRGTRQGSGLGRDTMPEMLEYSAVAAVTTLWLTARAYGIGIGWVSILNPERICEILEVPADWRLIAYLCIGYPERESSIPELEREGWEERREAIALIER